MTNHSPTQHLGAPHKGAMIVCRICGITFTARVKGQQVCGKPCQVKASSQKGWPGKVSEWWSNGERRRA